MRALALWTSVVSLCGPAISQPLGEAYWNKIKDRADSVVISRFGSAFFVNHIFPPIDALNYIALGDYTVHWDHRDTITRAPAHCHFEYDIGFDTLNASRMNIGFSITPEGALVEDEDLQGFVEGPAPIKFHTDLDGFITLARNNSVKCSRRTAFRELRWVPTDTALRIHPGGNGRYELVLGRIRGKKSESVSSSTRTYQVVDAIVFDPFTGAVLRKEERHETRSWACGRGFL